MNRKAQAPQPVGKLCQHFLLAAEEMSYAGDIEHEIAIRRRIGENRDDGAGIGMPIGEIGENRFEIVPVDFPHQEIRNNGAGIGQALLEPQPAPRGFLIKRHDAEATLDPFPEHQRPWGRGEFGISSLETVCRPARQAEHEVAAAGPQ